MAHDVFISYAHQNKAVADAAVAALEMAGVRCWVAPRDLRPGQTWPTAIPAAIREARILVLIFSRPANASSHVSREVNLALESGATIIPIRIEDVVPDDSLSYALSGVHWLDALTHPLDVHLDAMTNSVCAILERKARPQFVDVPSENGPVDSGPTRSHLSAVASPPAVLPQPGPAKDWPTMQEQIADLSRIVARSLEWLRAVMAGLRGPSEDSASAPPKQKSAAVALFLAVFLGWLGAHRFYLGKHKTAVAQGLTFGGLFVWWGVDIAALVSGRMTDAKGDALRLDTKSWPLVAGALCAFTALLGVAWIAAGIDAAFAISGPQELGTGLFTLMIGIVFIVPIAVYAHSMLERMRDSLRRRGTTVDPSQPELI